MADTILVVGATGMQGGGVARHLLKRGKFEVRCLTRHPNSEAARILEQQGAEGVQADLDDSASLVRAEIGQTSLQYLHRRNRQRPGQRDRCDSRCDGLRFGQHGFS